MCQPNDQSHAHSTARAAALTAEQRRILDGCSRGLGPYHRDDVGLAAEIVADIRLFVGVGHSQDLSWLTEDLMIDYLRSLT